MPKIQLEIQDCQDCPSCMESRMYTGDSWEHAFNYYCKKVEAKPENDNGLPYKKVAGYVEWRSEMPPVPDWCPLKVED